MPKAFKKKAAKQRAETESDSDANVEDTKPAQKKAKPSANTESDDGEGEHLDTKPAQKKAKPSANTESDDGEVEHLLSDKRRVTVTFFKGNHYVDIREFYSSNGKRMPGKKGIALKIDEWNKLKTVIADVDAQIQKSGAK